MFSELQTSDLKIPTNIIYKLYSLSNTSSSIWHKRVTYTSATAGFKYWVPFLEFTISFIVANKICAVEVSSFSENTYILQVGENTIYVIPF